MNIFTSPTRQGRRWRKEYFKELGEIIEQEKSVNKESFWERK